MNLLQFWGIHQLNLLQSIVMAEVGGTLQSGETPMGDPLNADRLTRLCQGDEAAFDELYLDLYPRVYRFIYRMIRDPSLAEELVNETFMVVWEKPNSFNHTSKVSTWVMGIAYRKTLKARVRQLRGADDLPMDDFSEVLSDRRNSTTREVDFSDLLLKGLSELSEIQRAVVELSSYHGLSYQEIAVILDCPENTVKTRMHSARQKLAPYLRLLEPDLDDYCFEATT